MSGTRVTAIVLAGGRSSRFGRDKLAEPFARGTVLDRAIAAVGPLVHETIAVAAPDAARRVPDGVILVHDPEPYGGPLVGLLTGLRRATSPVVLLVGGDMPTMEPSVLGALLAELADPFICAAILEHEGWIRPLPGALRAGPALTAVERLVVAGNRNLRAVYGALVTAAIAESRWRALDPEGRTLRDIDTPADLG